MLDFRPVYLLRKGNPRYLARRFFDSFFAGDEQVNGPLIVLLKGFDDGDMPIEIAELSEWVKAQLDPVYVSDHGLDLTAYRTLCELREESYFLFFNSNSVILHSDWRKIYQHALMMTEGKGLIGASGSYESGVMTDFVFPNPHIRTNAFLVAREDYLSAAAGSLDTKEDCHELESGKHSLTQFFTTRDLPTLIVNKDAELFEVDEWPKSDTFRLGDQDSLVVTDNRSQKYHTAFSKRRRHHASMSWGEHAATFSIPIWTTLFRIFWHRLCGNGYKLPRVLRPRKSRERS